MNAYGPTSPLAEPMTLGSPPQSQSLHHSFSHPSGQALGFLPGYLMGESGHSASPSSSTRLASCRSPNKGVTPSSLGPKDGFSRLERKESNHSQRNSINTTPKDHGNAPPVAGLYDQVDSQHGTSLQYIGTPERRKLDFHGGTVVSGSSGGYLSQKSNQSSLKRLSSQVSVHTGQSSVSRVFTPPTPVLQSRHKGLYSSSTVTAVSSPAQIDPFYTQGEAIAPDDDLDETWVTVFGFPPAAASFILQQFSQYGNIHKHVVASNGNWMHLHFSSKLQAKKALSKNGKIFGGNIMIGATPCIDKGVMEGGKENMYNTSSSGTPKRPLSSLEDETEFVKKKTPIRPLTAAYQAASNSHEVIPDHNTPQKSSNVVSKTMEYMFGW